MGEKDVIEKQLEDYNDVFADIVNVLLFNGKRVVQETALVNTATYSMYKADDALVHEQERCIEVLDSGRGANRTVWCRESNERGCRYASSDYGI